MKIKVCGITKVDQIHSLEESDISYIGLIFYPGSARFHNIPANELCKKRAQLVGVFVNEAKESVKEKATVYNLDLIQLHGDENPEYCRYLRSFGFKIIKVFSIGKAFDFSITNKYIAVVDYFLFDTKGNERGGNGIQFDWTILEEYTGDIPYFLSGGLRLEDAAKISAIKDERCVAVDINSQFEINAGIKDLELIKQFADAISS